MPKTYIGFNADDMFIGPKPEAEKMSLDDFKRLVDGNQYQSRCFNQDLVNLVEQKAAARLPIVLPRMMYMQKGDVYIEINVSQEQICFFRYIAPAT